MPLTIGVVALGLMMTALTLAELRQPIRASALKWPVGDRVLSLFAVAMFIVVFVNALIVLTTH
jgi:hypothetical protein